MEKTISIAKNMKKENRAFTLIELLIVVAIIAILSAIAVPNFLEAQVRSKVSRAKSDVRSIAIALESYYVEHNNYPLMREPGFIGGPPAIQGSELKWWYIPNVLSTPIGYLTTTAMWCPFGGNFDKAPYFPDEIWRRYGYENIEELIEKAQTWNIFSARYPPDAVKWSGPWRLQCVGPDRFWNPSVLYDSTNGTISGGDIIRTQLSSEGNIRPETRHP